MFAKFFIERPIAAAVLSVLITLGGVVGLARLPVALYPEITPPTVEVSAVYPGANAKIVEDTIASPIEQQVNGVEGMLYLSSVCTNDGTYTLTVTFKSGVDLNFAQVLVQNRVNLAERVLPEIVRRRGISVKKKSTSQLMIVNLRSPNRTRSDVYLSNYATIQLRDELARLEGVGDIQFLGERDYSMRVWLDPDKLTTRNLSTQDVVRSIEEQNNQVAAGQIGQPPAPRGQLFQYTISTQGRLQTPEQFANIVLKTDIDGRAVRLEDVCTKIELGAVGYDQTCTLDGQPSIALSIYQLPGTNALDTARRVRTKMQELRTKFPEDVDYSIVYDTTPFIEESVLEVFITLRDAILLVALVMLVFLQNWRSAIIPLAAVPTAIIGTFGIMAIADYSLNTLTLFGLVLAVGIVVDDAIVVVEAVEHYIEQGLSPQDATLAAMRDVSGPVIAVGLVLAAVFVPCLFIDGILGQFFRQFAVTIAISTLLSAFNSLTLSPALAALLLKPKHIGPREPLPRVIIPLLIAGGVLWAFRHYVTQLSPVSVWLESWLPIGWQNGLGAAANWVVPIFAGIIGLLVGWLLRVVLNRLLGYLFAAYAWLFEKLTSGYILLVKLMLILTPLVLIAYGVLVWGTVDVMRNAAIGFVPNQDKGYLIVNVQLPDSSSLTRTDRTLRQVDGIARQLAGVKHTIAVAGQSQLVNASAPNLGTLYVMLEPFEARHGPGLSAQEIGVKLQTAANAEISEGNVTVFGAPPIDGLGATGGIKLMVENRGEPDSQFLQATTDRIVTDLNQNPSLQGAFTAYRADTPWVELLLDREQAEAAGVPVGNIITSLQVQFGSLYVNDFNRFGRTWQVNVQADPKYRDDFHDPRKLTIRTRQGTVLPLAGFLKLRETTGPVMVTRYNLYPAAAITADPTPGVSTGDAIRSMEATARSSLPPEARVEWTESAFLQNEAGNSALWALLLSVVLVFLVLAAQYESWALPLAVILVVPLCLLCAALGVRESGQDVNIFTQVGFVVLIGLACKNAILIVEYARSRRLAGATRRDATLEACRLRLRPIAMTSIAFILGVVPLLLAQGAGAEMRQLLGTAVFYGMLGVTLFGVFLTPVFFFAIQWVVESVRPSRNATGGGVSTN
ncbi:MAG: efflux RND transporter permease subunit [Fimbriiglobus sp.]